jgi:hypothetical protein
MIQSSDMKPPRKPTIVNKTVDTSEEVEVVLSEKYSFLSAKIKRLISARRMRKIQAKAKNSAIVPTYDSDHTGDNSDTDSDTDTDTVIADNNSSPFSKVAIVPTRLVPTKDSDHTGDNSDTDADTYTDTDTDTDTDTYTDTDADTDADTDTDVDVKVRWKMQLIRRFYHFTLKIVFLFPFHRQVIGGM